MRLGLVTTFGASRKEPFAVLLDRIHSAFPAFGLEPPTVHFTLADAPVPGFTSSVDRVLRRYPQLEPFVCESAAIPGGPAIRRISNSPGSPAADEPMEFSTLHKIAEGVPRSFSFHSAQFWFYHPLFGPKPAGLTPAMTMPGIVAGDSWWVSGRSRSLLAMVIVEADPLQSNTPAPPDAVAGVLAACGKVKSRVQLPFAPHTEEQSSETPLARLGPGAAEAVAAIVRDHRARLSEIVDRAALPHELPPVLEALKQTPLSAVTGPKKPFLRQAFRPLGYECQGATGSFTLRRRTAGNLTVEIEMDVGTWSRSVTAHYQVHGLGFGAVLPLPVGRSAIGAGQYPTGDEKRWRQIVENLAALVAELDRSFVPAIESATGPSPDWYEPAR